MENIGKTAKPTGGVRDPSARKEPSEGVISREDLETLERIAPLLKDWALALVKHGFLEVRE